MKQLSEYTKQELETIYQTLQLGLESTSYAQDTDADWSHMDPVVEMMEDIETLLRAMQEAEYAANPGMREEDALLLLEMDVLDEDHDLPEPDDREFWE